MIRIIDRLGLNFLTDITMLGFSLGGGLVIRAAAREPRISRVIAMDICTSLFEASSAH